MPLETFYPHVQVMDTKFWGPGGWVFLHTITFNYPEKIDESNKDHVSKRRYTKELMENLQHTLPCKYCRRSFKKFLKRLPIDDHLEGRAKLTYWLYQIHNMVNEKLRRQEEEAVDAKMNKLEAAVRAGLKTSSEAYKELEEFAFKTMITEPDPSFADVCAYYEAHRAGCSKVTNGLAVCRSISTAD